MSARKLYARAQNFYARALICAHRPKPGERCSERQAVSSHG